MSSKKNRGGGDERFLRVQKDPRFWEMPEREHKIQIDERFRSMFHDERFKVTNAVDKRGRPVSHTSAEDLRRFYKVSEDEDEGGWCPTHTHARTTSCFITHTFSPDDEDGEEDAEEERGEASGSDESGVDSEDDDSGPDLARGKGNVETSSDEDEEDEVDAVLRREEEEMEHDWGELWKDAPRSDEVSSGVPGGAVA